jgi:hypothetical protein
VPENIVNLVARPGSANWVHTQREREREKSGAREGAKFKMCMTKLPKINLTEY